MLETLLVGHTKALFFVNHHQTQILETNIFRQHPVSTYDYVNLTCFDALNDVLLFLSRTKTREQFNFHGERSETRAKSIVVLISKDRGGSKHCCLLSFHH